MPPFELLAAVGLLIANGFFVAVEFAVARTRPTQVEDLVRERKPGAKSVKHAVDNIDAYLAACQLGITISSLGLGVLGEEALHDILEDVFGEAATVVGVGVAGTIAFLIITMLHVVVGELAPKSLAIARTGRTVAVLAPPMRIFYLATKPVVDLFNGMGNLLLKPFGIPPAREAGSEPHTEDELRALLRQSSRQGFIAREEQEFSENVLLYGDRRVREVMKPRPDIDYLMTDQSLADAAALAAETGHTRFPLVEPEGGLDEAVGVLNVKDFLQPLLAGDAQATLKSLARPLLRFADGTVLDEVLRELRRHRSHLAIVVDEHGTAVGVVTIEDIIEEIVGEIEDEFDPDAQQLVRQDGESVVVDGQASLHQVAEATGVELDDHHEATIGGHLLERLGRVPEAGETLEVEGRQVEVTRVGEARIEQLRFPARASAPQHPGG